LMPAFRLRICCYEAVRQLVLLVSIIDRHWISLLYVLEAPDSYTTQ
jgi:hypothetical protein